MVNYLLKITADLENLASLQPQGGCDDPVFTFYFKFKCGKCGEVSSKDSCVSLNETVPLSNGRATTHLIQKCKFCNREGTATMLPGRGRPLTQELSEAGKYAPLMVFDCRGFEPLEFSFGAGWKVESVAGTTFENVDLSAGEFIEYDEIGERPVMVSNLRASFDVVK
ncbi:hypothetical protein Dimus_010654 [Dionaea muscipula]